MTDSPDNEREPTPDSGAADAGDPGGASRGGGYEQRIEDWVLRLRDEAEQKAPEVLSELAATAKSFATYLEDMADQVRAKREQEAAEAEPEPAPADEPTSEPSRLENPDPSKPHENA